MHSNTRKALTKNFRCSPPGTPSARSQWCQQVNKYQSAIAFFGDPGPLQAGSKACLETQRFCDLPRMQPTERGLTTPDACFARFTSRLPSALDAILILGAEIVCYSVCYMSALRQLSVPASTASGGFPTDDFPPKDVISRSTDKTA